MKRWLMVLFPLTLILTLFSAGCGNREGGQAAGGAVIAVFIPGVIAGSPIYEMLAGGAEKAVRDYAASRPGNAPSLLIVEGGFNQAEWENQITTMAASGSFDLIVSSNPSLPDIVRPVSSNFPNQKFLLFDAEYAGNPNVYTLYYNQREKAFMAGHIAALVSQEMSPGAKRIGFVAGQEFPVMNNVILPGFTEGARAVDPDFTVDFRVVGNWFDAARAGELAAAMIRGGANVLLPNAGGANHGVVQAASEAGAKVVWFDSNGYAVRPGVVVGSSVLRQDKAAYEKIKLYLEGNLPFGKAEIAGVADGFVDFIEDDPHYITSVSQAVRDRQAVLTSRFRSGELRLD